MRMRAIMIMTAAVLLTVVSVSAQDYVYVVNSYVHGDSPYWATLAKLNADDLEIVDTLQLYDNAHTVAITPDRSRLWVTCPPREYIMLIDTETFTSITTIDLGDIILNRPMGAAITPDGNQAYVTFEETGEIGIYNASTAAYVDTVSIGGRPNFIVFTSDGEKAYIVDYQNADVYVLRTSDNTVTTVLDFDGYALQDAVITPDDSRVYVSNMAEDQIEVIRTSDDEALAPITTDEMKPRGIGISPDGEYLFIGHYLGVDAVVNMMRLSDETIVSSADIPSNPRRIAVNAAGSRIYVTEHNEDECYAYDVSGESLTYADSVDLNTEPGYNASPVGIVISEEPSSCSTLGCSIELPETDFGAGDEYYCNVTFCNTNATTMEETPVFAILDVYGEYFFAPSFSSFDHYTYDLNPGETLINVLDPFVWPSGAGSGTATWYAGATNPEITDIIGELDTVSFDWHP